MNGPKGTLFEGEVFTLSFKFGPKYPFDSPEVIFVGENIPVHPHVYSNGHICLSILTEDWSPALSVQAVCLSIISMLASAKEKVIIFAYTLVLLEHKRQEIYLIDYYVLFAFQKRPPDNSFYVKTCHKNPKKTKWWYHDDSV